MKTPARQSPGAGSSHSHSHHHSHTHIHNHVQSPRPGRSSKHSTTPSASPRTPYSVGQNHPPKLSPARPADVRSQSPNYFGLIVESTNDPRDSGAGARDNWSPVTSSVKSFGAAIPKQVPLDANPEFEAFKRQADLNKGKSFALSTSHYVQPPTASTPVRPRAPPRWNTHSSDTPSSSPFGRQMSSLKDPRPASRMDVDQDSLHDSAYVSSDSKRNSESSLLPASITSMPRFESPAPMNPSQQLRTNISRVEDRDPRLSMMEHKVDPPSPKMGDITRANTLPMQLETGQPSMISGQQLKDMLAEVEKGSLLLLDIRSSQNYARSRIDRALNLCIPTTLLKRATFNINKLQQTFPKGPDSDRFAKWREAGSIVVYDAQSSDQRDAVTAQNMIKKFTNEGYTGKTFILRGGFSIFQDTFPECVDDRSTAEIAGGNPQGAGGLAPVIGGVMLPTSGDDRNPFFSNIRQNMDLADGVGQLDVTRPSGLESPSLPKWLRQASAPSDHGKQIASKFYSIERDEQSRMRSAYAAFNPKNADPKNKVQLCGVEKGGKNRYKDILPFEHARVKLQGKPEGSCDYINASHLKASRSNKRYIASQGPLPATFEDFWSVIWEQDVRVVVMLTAESEGGQLKCHPYWKGRDHGAIRLMPLSEKKASLDIDRYRADSTHTPSSSSMGEFGRKRANTTTSMDSSTPTSQSGQGLPSEAPHVIIRKFALSHAAHPFAPMREITHLHFPAWPDFGTPAQPSHLLALVELANVMQRAALPVDSASIMESRKNSGTDSLPITWYDEPEADARTRPMLVHCSAGCGRTGTFCTVDSVIDMMKRERQMDVAGALSKDSEGDVSMIDSDDAVSPKTDKRMDFKPHSRQASINKRAFKGSAPIDTAWLQDDMVDLIQATVEDFRGQRLSMVQSLRQFVLCYETVLEWISRMNERGNNSISGRTRSGSLHQTRQ